MKRRLLTMALTTAVLGVDAKTELIYVPKLTGQYKIGDIAEPYYSESMGPTLLPATLREHNQNFAWSGSAPRYLTFEMLAVVHEPKYVISGDLQSYEHPSKININFGYSFNPRPGVGGGTTFNQNSPSSPGVFRFEHTYNGDNGRVYFSMLFDTVAGYSDPCCSAWGPGAVSNLVASLYAVFYNYNSFEGGQVKYINRGSVFVESARVGLTDTLYIPSSVPIDILVNEPPSPVPEPLTSALFFLGLVLVSAVSREKIGA